MLTSLWISEPLGQAEINNMDYVLLFAMTNQEIIGLHVAMNEVIIVQEFQPLNHLISNHKSGFNCEFALAKIEGILETWTEQIHYHCVVITLDAEPMNGRDASY